MARNVVQWLQKQRADQLLETFKVFCIETNIVPDYEEQPHDEMTSEMAVMIPDIGVGRRQKKKLYLAPRYTYKTSIVVAFICFLLCKYPNIRIMLFRATRELSVAMLKEVKLILETNEQIHYAFGNLSIGAAEWSSERITIGTRTRPDRDPSVATAGIQVMTTGSHPDIVIMDDLVTYENCDSLTEMENAWGLIQSMFPLLPAWGSILVTGTRWSNIDTYSRILENNAKQREASEEPSWEEYIREIYFKDENGEEQLFFPARLHEEFIAQQRRDIEPRWFYAWYYNQPYETGLKPFTNLQFFTGKYHHSWFNYIELDRAEWVDYRIPIKTGFALDCALTATQDSDRFGFVVGGVDSTRDWWLLEAHEWHKLPSDITDLIGTQLLKYHPDFFIIESQNADVKMVARIQDMIRDYELETVILSYSALQDEARGKRGKAQRIASMEPINRNGKMHIRRQYCGPLVRQMDLYPGITKDDVIDACAMLHKGFDTIALPASTYEEAVRRPIDNGLEPVDAWREKILNPEQVPDWLKDALDRHYPGPPGRNDHDRGNGMWTGPKIWTPR